MHQDCQQPAHIQNLRNGKEDEERINVTLCLAEDTIVHESTTLAGELCPDNDQGHVPSLALQP